MKLKIQQSHIDHFLGSLWKDTRQLQVITDKNQTSIRRHADNQISIEEEFELLVRLNDIISFNIPRIIAHTPSYISYEYIFGTRAFNLIKDLKIIHESNNDLKCIDLCLGLMDLLRSNLSEFQRKTSGDPILKNIDQKYPATEKIVGLYRLLQDVLLLENGESDLIHEDLEKIIAIYSEASNRLFRDATPKNVILNIPGLHQDRFKSQSQRLEALQHMVSSGELKDRLTNETLFHIDFSGCLFLCPEMDDWIALEHHEATHWLSEHIGQKLVEHDPLNLCTAFVRFSRFGGRKLAYRLLNWSGYQIRFCLDNEIFYFNHLKSICKQLHNEGITSQPNLSALMDELVQCCGIVPDTDYLHSFRPELSRTPYYQDVFPN